jgi:hypothetical protein
MLPIEVVPEGGEARSVQMSLVRVELDDGHTPLGNVRIERYARHLEVKALDAREYLGRVAVAERPVLELPLLAHCEHGHHAVPLKFE